MKTILLSLGLFFVTSLAMTQDWAPAGATWHYDWASFWVSGYVKIQYTGDTTVAGKTCKILKKERYTYDWNQHVYSNELIGYEFTYEENNVVYYYRNNQFFELYDFNAAIGNSWTISGWNATSPCDSTGTVVVEGSGTETINSVPLKYLKVSPGSSSTWAFSSDTIFERIGSLGYMFPEPTCVVDVFEGGPLRCYYDNSFGLYERGIAPSCDYITGINYIPSEMKASIYPVPATSNLTVETSQTGMKRIEISDILGNKLIDAETIRKKLVLDISVLPAGVYLITVHDKTRLILQKKFVKI